MSLLCNFLSSELVVQLFVKCPFRATFCQVSLFMQLFVKCPFRVSESIRNPVPALAFINNVWPMHVAANIDKDVDSYICVHKKISLAAKDFSFFLTKH